MAEMNVSMKLTLLDTGSAGVRAFMNLLTQLQGVVTAVDTGLGKLQQAIRSTGAAATASTRAHNDHNAAIARTATSAAKADAANAALAATTNVLSASLGKVVAIANAVAASLNGVAAAQMNVNAANNGQMAQNLGHANTQATQLSQTLKGIAQIWGALEIKKALTVSAQEAIQYETTQTKLRNMNISAGERDELVHAANTTSKVVPQFNLNEALELGIDLRNATGSVAHAVEMLTPFAKAVYDMKLALPHDKQWSTNDSILVAKILEQRGATMDPVRMQAELDMITKVVSATQGRVDPSQLLGNLQYARGGLGAGLDIEFLPVMAAMIERIKAGGGNGGQVGTGLTTLQQAVIGGAGSEKAQKERAALGLIDPDKLTWNSNGNINQQKSNLQMAGGALFMKNPDSWVQEVIVPALKRAGINILDQHAVNMEVNKLFPNRMAAEQVSTLINQRPLLQKDAANITQAAGSEEQYANNVKTARANIDAFKAQMESLGIVLGTTLLPTITAIAKAFTEVFSALQAFFTAFPITAQFVTLGLAIASVALAIAGFSKVFGIIINLSTLLKALGPAAAVAATGATAAAATTGVATVAVASRFTVLAGLLGTFASFVAKTFLKMIPLVGLLVVAWDLYPLIANFEIGGKKISEWAINLMDNVVTSFKNGWARVQMYLGFISIGAGEAKITANNQANVDNLRKRAASKFDALYEDQERKKAASAFDKAYEAQEARKANKVSDGSLLFKPQRPPAPTAKGGADRFKNYDAELDDAKNAYRLEDDNLKRKLREEDELYRLGKLSIEDYYAEKLRITKEGITAEIGQLKLEEAAYRKQGDKAGVNRVTTDIAIKNRTLQDTEKSLDLQKEADLNTLKKESVALDATILRNEGRKIEARLAASTAALEIERKRFALNKDDASVAKIDKIIEINKAEAEMEKFETSIRKVQEGTKAREEELNNQIRLGVITPLAGEQALYELRQKESAQLDILIAKMKAYVLAANIPEDVKTDIIGKLDKASASSDSLKDPLTPIERQTKTEVDGAIKDGMVNMFSQIFKGAKTASQAISEFGQNLKNTFLDIIAKRLGTALFDSLFGATTKSGSDPGIMGSITSWLFGSKLPSFAIGTDYVPHDMIAQIHEGERILTADENASFSNSSRMGNSQGQQRAQKAPILQIHPDVFHMRLGDWFEGEMARHMATR